MSQLTILSDTVIKSLLLDLSADELIYFQTQLESCLIDFSTGTKRQYQPSPSVINRPEGQKILFRPFTGPAAVGTKIIVTPAPPTSTPSPHQHDQPNSSKQTPQPPLYGVIVLMNGSGIPTGLLNAEEITGFRTTMSAMIPFTWRRRTQNIIIWGAGKQALLHARLALALRGRDIESITIVNRSAGTAEELIKTVKEENATRWKANCTFSFVSSSSQESVHQLLKSTDAIFCTVPSTQPLFPLTALNLQEKPRSNHPLITAIGSWQATMLELDPSLLQHGAHTHTNTYPSPLPSPLPHSPRAILVDDISSALLHSGEIIQSGLKREQLLELGEVLKRMHEGGLEMGVEGGLEGGVEEWLREGLVVYKSVGVSVTDLVAGEAVLEIARRKGVGWRVEGF